MENVSSEHTGHVSANEKQELMTVTAAATTAAESSMPSASEWQPCVDQASGYTYYWNTLSGEVTWHVTSALTSALLQPPPPPPPPPPSDTGYDKAFMDKGVVLISSYGGGSSDSDSDSVDADQCSPAAKRRSVHSRTDSDRQFGPHLPPAAAVTAPSAAAQPPPQQSDEEPADEEQDEQQLLRLLRDKAAQLRQLGGQLPAGVAGLVESSPPPTQDTQACSRRQRVSESRKRRREARIRSGKSLVTCADPVATNAETAQTEAALSPDSSCHAVNGGHGTPMSGASEGNEDTLCTSDGAAVLIDRSLTDIMADIEREVPPDHEARSHVDILSAIESEVPPDYPCTIVAPHGDDGGTGGRAASPPRPPTVVATNVVRPAADTGAQVTSARATLIVADYFSTDDEQQSDVDECGAKQGVPSSAVVETTVVELNQDSGRRFDGECVTVSEASGGRTSPPLLVAARNVSVDQQQQGVSAGPSTSHAPSTDSVCTETGTVPAHSRVAAAGFVLSADQQSAATGARVRRRAARTIGLISRSYGGASSSSDEDGGQSSSAVAAAATATTGRADSDALFSRARLAAAGRGGLGFGGHRESSIGDDDNVAERCVDEGQPGALCSSRRVEFVRGEVMQPSSHQSSTTAETTDSERMGSAVDDLHLTVSSKLRFLGGSIGELSALAVKLAQCEALCGAWRAGALTVDYFGSWLRGQNEELLALERDSTPAGWNIEWNSERGCYKYTDQRTAAVCWEYPLNGGRSPDVTKNDCGAGADEASLDSPASRGSDVTVPTVECRPAGWTSPQTQSTSQHTPDTRTPDHATCLDAEERAVEQDGSDGAMSSALSSAGGSHHIMSAELDSFYSEVGMLETAATQPPVDDVTPPTSPLIAVDDTATLERRQHHVERPPAAQTPPPPAAAATTAVAKKKKKKALSSTLTLKKRGVDKMVAKWQSVQKQLQ